MARLNTLDDTLAGAFIDSRLLNHMRVANTGLLPETSVNKLRASEIDWWHMGAIEVSLPS